MYRLCVRVQEKGEASAQECVATTRRHLFHPPQKWHHAVGQKSRNPPVVGRGRREGLSHMVSPPSKENKHVCCPYVRQKSKYPQWRHSCVASTRGSRGERRLYRFIAASDHHRACDVLSLLQAGREGARCEKGQRERERRRQPASRGGLGITCGQLQAVPTLGCTPSSSAAGWCPLRRQTRTGCSLYLLHM